jgi:hypothetical protein
MKRQQIELSQEQWCHIIICVMRVTAQTAAEDNITVIIVDFKLRKKLKSNSQHRAGSITVELTMICAKTCTLVGHPHET